MSSLVIPNPPFTPPAPHHGAQTSPPCSPQAARTSHQKTLLVLGNVVAKRQVRYTASASSQLKLVMVAKWEVATEVSRASVISVLTDSSHLGLLLCCRSVAESCPALCNPTDCSTPGLPVCPCLWSLLKLVSVESMMPSHHLILCCPLLITAGV